MSGWASLLRAWDFEPSIVIGCVGLLLADLAALRWRPSRVRASFVIGVLVLAFALMSPLDALSDDYLFSAHMLQHLLLIVIASPFLLAGLPVDPLRRLLRVPWIARVERILGWPPVAWLLGIGTLVAWHVPALYNAALASEDLHIVEHLCFLVSATIFWWPLLAPLPESRTRLGPALAYLVSGGFANALVGLILFAIPVGLYPAYIHPEDPLHVLEMIRGAWGLSAAEDQQFGGVLMVLGGSMAFGYAAFYMLWLHRDDGPSTRRRFTSAGAAPPRARTAR